MSGIGTRARVTGLTATPTTGRFHVVAIAVGLVLAVVRVRWLMVSVHIVESGSMTPTARQGDVVVVNRLTPRWSKIHRGKLIVFEGREGRLLKRVVGVAGDTVVIKDAILFVNGEAVKEPYVDHSRVDASYSEQVVVPEDHVYVLGDARDNSIDSREFGSVDLDDIEGRAVVLW